MKKYILLLLAFMINVSLFATELIMNFDEVAASHDVIKKPLKSISGNLPIVIFSPAEVVIDNTPLGHACVLPAKDSGVQIKFRGPEFAVGYSLKLKKETNDSEAVLIKTTIGCLNLGNSDDLVLKLMSSGAFSVAISSKGQVFLETDNGVCAFKDENNSPVFIKANEKNVSIEIFVDIKNKKCQFIVDGVQQGGEIDFFQANKFKNVDIISLRSISNCNDTQYIQGAVYNFDYITNATLPVVDKKVDLTPRVAATRGSYEVATDAKNIVATTELKANDSFILNQKIDKASSHAPARCWAGVGSGKGEFYFAPDANGKAVANLKSTQGLTRLQYGIITDVAKIKKAAGQIVTFEATVDTKNITKGEGPVMNLELAGVGGQGLQVSFAPSYSQANKGKVTPTLGTNSNLKIKETFILPEGTEIARLLCYHMNSDGESTWKDVKFYYSPDAKEITFPMRKKFDDIATVKKINIEKNLQRFKRLQDLIVEATGPMPSGDSLYVVKDAINSKHPKMLPDNLTLEELTKRGQDKNYAPYVNKIHELCKVFLNLKLQKPNMESEDPLRAIVHIPMWYAMAYLIEGDSTQKAVYLNAYKDSVKTIMSWGLPVQDLPLSSEVYVLSVTYDWLYDQLDEDLRKSIRKQLIDAMRLTNEHSLTQFAMWRYNAFSANHNWFNYMAQAITAITLWNSSDPYVDKQELKKWLDDSVQNFYYVEHIHSKDGFGIEGPLYQDYGLGPYLDYAIFSEKFLDTKYQLIDTDGIRKMASARLSTLLPNNQGFMQYSDSKKDEFTSFPFFQYFATRFQDKEAQALSEIMIEKSKNAKDYVISNGFLQKLNSLAWRNMLWYNPSVTAVDLKTLPLFKNGDQLGLYVARSSWSDKNASFFGLRCGHPIGKSAYSFFGEFESNGHCYPEQGSFSFYIGNDEILPGVSYERIKQTSFHNLILFEGKHQQKDKWVGQVGEGAAWFNISTYRTRQAQKSPEVIKNINDKDYHMYLCDIGGFYAISNSMDTKDLIFPDYKRILVYLPKEDVVVIADKVQISDPRTLRFRLLTGGKTMTLAGRDFDFNINNRNYLVRDFSTNEFKRSAKFEQTYTWSNQDRQVAELISEPTTQAVFVVAIGNKENIEKLQVKADENGLVITNGSQKINCTWNK